MCLLFVILIGNNALEILIAGVIGWALLIILALVVIVALVCTRSKSNGKKKLIITAS